MTAATDARGAARARGVASHRLALPIALALLVALAIVAIGLGRYSLGVAEVLDLLQRGPSARGADDTASAIVWQIRLPRIGVAMLVGAGLASAGAAFQQLFRNPLVAPDTLGVSSGPVPALFLW